MNAGQVVDIVSVYEERLRYAREAEAAAKDREHYARGRAREEAGYADALAEALREVDPAHVSLAEFDLRRNPPQMRTVLVPQGGSVKVLDAEGNET